MQTSGRDGVVHVKRSGENTERVFKRAGGGAIG